MKHIDTCMYIAILAVHSVLTLLASYHRSTQEGCPCIVAIYFAIVALDPSIVALRPSIVALRPPPSLVGLVWRRLIYISLDLSDVSLSNTFKLCKPEDQKE
jgi:hypothetical protein